MKHSNIYGYLLQQQLQQQHYLFSRLLQAQGPSGEFVGGMAKTVILSITSSLFLALYVVPVLLNYLDQIKFFEKEIFGGNGYSNEKLLRRYRAVLTWSYDVPKRGIMIAMILPAARLYVFSHS